MGSYQTFETFILWFDLIFLGLVLVIPWLCLLTEYLEWKKMRRKQFERRTVPSDDFMVETRQILDIIQDRLDGVPCGSGLMSKEDRKAFAELRDSSEVYSLARYAHYAGYHLTFEQQPDGGVDLDADNPDVFKTDMRKAASSLEEKEWAPYRRY